MNTFEWRSSNCYSTPVPVCIL